jgi:hypothetical protein
MAGRDGIDLPHGMAFIATRVHALVFAAALVMQCFSEQPQVCAGSGRTWVRGLDAPDVTLFGAAQPLQRELGFGLGALSCCSSCLEPIATLRARCQAVALPMLLKEMGWRTGACCAVASSC